MLSIPLKCLLPFTNQITSAQKHKKHNVDLPFKDREDLQGGSSWGQKAAMATPKFSYS
jgi:hypothetical protein